MRIPTLALVSALALGLAAPAFAADTTPASTPAPTVSKSVDNSGTTTADNGKTAVKKASHKGHHHKAAATKTKASKSKSSTSAKPSAS